MWLRSCYYNNNKHHSPILLVIKRQGSYSVLPMLGVSRQVASIDLISPNGQTFVLLPYVHLTQLDSFSYYQNQSFYQISRSTMNLIHGGGIVPHS